MFFAKKTSLIVAISILLILSNQIFSSLAISHEWVTQSGSTGIDRGNAIALDASANVYTTGSFQGTVDFDPGVAVSNLSSAGNDDFFVQKLDTNGNFIWAFSIGGTQSDRGYAIEIDGGNIYIAGYFRNTVDFDPGAGVSNLISAGNNDIFVLKLDTNGNFIWATRMGGSEDDNGYSLTLDSSGNVYTTGYFRVTGDFDPSAATFNLTSNGNLDIFVQKLDTNGNFIWAVGVGGVYVDIGVDIVLDASDNVYISGTYSYTVDFDPSAGSYTVVGLDLDAFVLKLDSGSNFQWVAALIGGSFDDAVGVDVDSSGNVYVTGEFGGTLDFDPGAGVYNLTAVGINSYVLKLDTNGNFIWAVRLGDGIIFSHDLHVDFSDNIYVAGGFLDTIDFDPSAGTSPLNSAGNMDAFVLKLDSNSNFLGAVAMGGAAADSTAGIVVDASQSIYITGEFTGAADFDPSPLVENLVSAGSLDIFVQKFNNLQTVTVEFVNLTASSLETVGTPPQLIITTSDALQTQTSVIVQVIANAGTATDTVDYQLIGTIIIPAGTASNSAISVSPLTIIDDSMIEPDETIDLEVVNISGAIVSIQNLNTYTIVDDDTPPPTSTSSTTDIPESEHAINIFDPAISKIGFLQPNQVGVSGEELEWIVTVSNISNVAGQNVIIQDNINPAMQINSVVAPGATATISGQMVSITYPLISVGQTVQFSIFTTVLNGQNISNTVCVTASNQGVEECATAMPVSQLPQTGETPTLAIPVLLMLCSVLGIALCMKARQ